MRKDYQVFNKESAVLSPLAYIKGARIIEAKGSVSNRRDKAPFSYWVSLKRDLILVVDPSQAVIDLGVERRWGDITSVQISKSRMEREQCVIIVEFKDPSSPSGFTRAEVAGLAGLKEMGDHIAALLKNDDTASDLIKLAVDRLNKS